MGLKDLSILDEAQSRSISPENFSGKRERVAWPQPAPEKGAPATWAKAGKYLLTSRSRLAARSNSLISPDLA